MIGYDLLIIREVAFTDRALSLLFNDLPILKVPHLRRRSELPIAAWMVRILNPPHWHPRLPIASVTDSTAAEPRSVNRAEFIPSQLHLFAPLGKLGKTSRQQA